MSYQEISTAGVPGKEARTWGMICHIAALAGFCLPPLGFILGPLIVWAIKKDDDPFINDQGKEAINFQLTMLICFVIAGILMLIIIGIFLLVALGLFILIMTVVAAIKANEGVTYRYPFTIRFIR